MRLSIVIPLYNEQDTINEMWKRLKASLDAMKDPYEVIFVDDGSADDTLNMLKQIQTLDKNVRVFSFSRNFGHQAAVSAGIDKATGAAVILMDGDLQDPPEVLCQFVDKWKEGYDVVYAIRTKRKEHFLKRFAYFMFYRILRAISDINIPLDSGDFCIMDRKVVDALKKLPEKTRFVRGLRTFVGFKQTGLAYERSARAAGKSKYTLSKLAALAVDGLVSFSSYPLKLVTYAGLITVTLAIGLSIWAILDAIWNSSTPRGWASTLIVVLFMSAVQLISLGIIGEYIRRIFIEVKSRPTYILREENPEASPHEQ